MFNRLNKHSKYIVVFVFSFTLVVASFYFRSELVSLGKWGLVGIFLINIIGSATLFVPAPAIATVVAGGIVYNPLIVALLAGLGSAVGDMVGYLLGQSGKQAFFSKNSMKYGVTKDIFAKFGPVFIIFFAFVPNPIFDAVGLLAGVFLYPVKKFFVYTFIGRLLRNLLLAYLGAAL